MTTVVSVAQGGTGSNSAALARTALGVPPSAAYDQANTARDQANTARTQANTGYDQANTARGQANTAYAQANAAYGQANSAYGQANAAYGAANTRLSASGGTLSGDLIITGNLTVSGNSTTLNTEILTVEDADVVLLSNVASTPALNAGIIVNRGTSTNTFIRWAENVDEWGWSDNGTTTYFFDDLRQGLITTNTTFGTVNTNITNTNSNAINAYAQANSAFAAANNRVLKAGDTMTGQLNISSGGLLVTGNVGFGTASPSRRLHLSSSGTDCGIRIDNTVSGRPALLLYDDSQNLTITNSSDTGYIGFINGTGAGTERVRIANTGSVGIGTNNPATTLHVDASGGGIVRVSRLGTGAGIMQMEADGTDGALSTTNNLRFQTASTERGRFTSGGDLLVGTTSTGASGIALPTSYNYSFAEGSGNSYANLFRQLNTAATVLASGYKRSNTAGFASSFGTSMARAAIAVGYNNGSIAFFSDSATNIANGTDITPTERLTITNAGYVGIGTTNIPRRLTVQALGTGNYEMVVGWAAQSLSQNATMDVICTHDNLAFQVWDDNNYTTPRFVVERGGDVGIGTTNPTQKLDVVGNIKASGTIAANGTIDVAGDGGAGYVGSRIVLRTHNNYRGAGIFLVGETSAVSNNTFYIGTPYSDHSGGLYFRHTANNYQTDYQSAAYTAAGNTIMYMSPGGNVGIGTNTPQVRLDLGTQGGTVIKFNPGTAVSSLPYSGFAHNDLLIGGIYASSYPHHQISFGHTADALRKFSIGSANDANFNASTVFVPAVTITSGGSVGINTASPTSKLHIAGNTQIYSGTTGYSPPLIFGSETGDAKKAIFMENYWMVYQGHDNEGHKFRSVNAGGSFTDDMTISGAGAVTIPGSLSKGSGSFKIDHPLPEKSNTHFLVHSFIEGPQADLIYRGRANLINGIATVNIDTAAGMTEGTFVLLCRDVQCFTSNETDWDNVRGSVSNNILTIECQNASSNATIAWMVIGERQDKHMYDTEWTDEIGKVIVEPEKPAIITPEEPNVS